MLGSERLPAAAAAAAAISMAEGGMGGGGAGTKRERIMLMKGEGQESGKEQNCVKRGAMVGTHATSGAAETDLASLAWFMASLRDSSAFMATCSLMICFQDKNQALACPLSGNEWNTPLHCVASSLASASVIF